MSNQQVVAGETKEFLPTHLSKSEYYMEQGKLIYIVDFLPDRDFFLVEDVRSNHLDWRSADSLKIESKLR